MPEISGAERQQPRVRPATAADLPAISRTLARAFADDPVWEFLVRRRDRWAARAAGYFAHDAGNRLRHGMVLVDEHCRGAALWMPPDAWRAKLSDLAREMPSAIRLLGRRLPRALLTLSFVEKAHPKAPHNYLAVLGTDPDHQGKGIGSALITHVTDTSDEEGMACYLESSKESNVPYYARHGFEVTEAMVLPGGGPTVWGMWREPR